MIKTTIVGFGDSLTFGYGVAYNVNYVDRLERYMPQYYPSISWNIVNSGINGDTIDKGVLRLQKDVLNYNPNIVILLFGTNDSAEFGDSSESLAKFETTYTTVINRIKSHNNRTGLNHCIPIPVLLTLPPVIDSKSIPFVKRSQIQNYNIMIKNLSEKLHCPLIDFYTYALEESNGCADEYFQSDGIHLSTAGYDILYDCVFSGISRLINYEGILKDYDTIAEEEI